MSRGSENIARRDLQFSSHIVAPFLLGKAVQEISSRGESELGWCKRRAGKPVQALLFHKPPAALHASMVASAQGDFRDAKFVVVKGAANRLSKITGTFRRCGRGDGCPSHRSAGLLSRDISVLSEMQSRTVWCKKADCGDCKPMVA
jgi:hypothetical protein